MPVYKWLVYALWALTALAFQLCVLPYLTLWGVHPNITPLLMGVVVTFESGPAAAVFGFLLGSWCDAFFPPSEIFFTLLFTLAGLLAAKAVRYLFRKSLMTALIWTTGFSVITNLLYFIIFYYIPARAGIEALWQIALPEMALSLPFLPILYWTGRVIDRRYQKSEEP